MAYLLDTTAFSDLMREHPQMQTRLASLSPDETVAICTVVRGEILHGIARLPTGQRRDNLAMKATHLFAAVLCLPIAELVADHYAEIKLDFPWMKTICGLRPQHGNPVPHSSAAILISSALTG